MALLRKWLARCAITAACALSACAALQPAADLPKPESTALARPEQTALGRVAVARAKEHQGLSGFRLLSVGADGFLARMQMLKAAQRTIDVQYFLFEDGDTGKLITDAMREAADRGVRVRLLVDDADFSRRGALIAALDAHPNVEVRIFNPFTYRGTNKVLRGLEFLFSASRLDFRMHNKLFVADNAAALVGGRNVGDRYFLTRAEAEFEDDDVFAIGPVVPVLSATFDDYWRSPLAVPLEALSEAPGADEVLSEPGHEDGKPDPAEYKRRAASGTLLEGLLSGRLPLVWARATVVCDAPEEKLEERGRSRATPTKQTLLEAAGAARSQLLIVSPYFIPSGDNMKLLEDLRGRGVQVDVLTNSLESVDGAGELMAFAAYAPYRPKLLEQGIRLHELKPFKREPLDPKTGDIGQFALHAKAVVIDGRRLLIGSANFDPRSMHLNTEIGLLIESPELARQVAARYEGLMRRSKSYEVTLEEGGRLAWRTERDGKPVAYHEEPARDEKQRAKVAILSRLPLDEEL